ncbi:hypothetical protein ONZ43_g6059 [Nemania bipapillata]|uniref:Uncharacterized protein n=1 Tax=Nemania bipapillata TaxID=110536 RepID=A0ACC2I2Y7_9PEZI|nr:hypothetical protein ONZ43_g6059 [Nemania bipapillata]
MADRAAESFASASTFAVGAAGGSGGSGSPEAEKRIPCVIPSSADRPPRWARRLERVAYNAAAEERLAQAAQTPTAQVMERLRNLENLVKDLSSQLEQAHAAANSSAGNSPASSTQDRDGDHPKSTAPSPAASNIQSRFGRLVLNDASRSRYVSSGFWSRVNDELDEIRNETQYLAEADLDSSGDEELSGASPSTFELERTASERHAFLFRHNLNSSGLDPRELHPLPSQVPFLLDVFYENVNLVVQIVHMPTIRDMARSSRGSDITQLTPANEALMFSIYYAAVTSMEDDDETPEEREGITDMVLPIVSMEISNISRQMMSPGTGLAEQNRLLDSIYTTLEEKYLRFSSEPGNIAYWVIVVTTRLVVGKLTLFTHLPVLFSSPGDHFSDEVRNKLLVAAIEVAELNHALNAEKACRQWRWVYQTYTHWHAIVYILLDICRRPWSPIVDRAWTALHSPWLVPARSKLDKDLRTWVPLRRLMLKARKYREVELGRLRADPFAARQLEVDDQKLPLPATVGSVSASAAADIFRDNWHFDGLGQNDPTRANVNSQSLYPSMDPLAMHESLHDTSVTAGACDTMAVDDQPFNSGLQFNAFSETTIDWPGGHPESGGLLGWFWADSDPSVDVFADAGTGSMDFNMNLDGEIDWLNWVESAKGMEMDAHTSANKPNS